MPCHTATYSVATQLCYTHSDGSYRIMHTARNEPECVSVCDVVTHRLGWQPSDQLHVDTQDLTRFDTWWGWHLTRRVVETV